MIFILQYLIYLWSEGEEISSHWYVLHYIFCIFYHNVLTLKLKKRNLFYVYPWMQKNTVTKFHENRFNSAGDKFGQKNFVFMNYSHKFYKYVEVKQKLMRYNLSYSSTGKFFFFYIGLQIVIVFSNWFLKFLHFSCPKQESNPW